MAELIEGILETALYAGDLDAAKAFYGGVLGLETIQHAEDRHVFFRCGPGVLLVFNAEATERADPASRFPVPPHGARGPGHACFRVRGERLNAMAERLKAAGVAIEADFRWPNGARSLYFRDPAGNSLECAEPAIWNMEEN